MGTHEPEKLLSLWASEEIDIKMAVGYHLQNTVKLQQGQTAIRTTLRQLQTQVNTLETKTQIQQTAIERLQRLIEGLLARLEMNPGQAKKKPAKKS